MKIRWQIPLVALTIFSATSLISCGGEKKLENDGTYYENKLVYDSSKEAYNVSVKLKNNKKVKSLSCSRAKSKKGDFSVTNGIITISGSFMSQIGVGEKDITVTFSDDKTEKINSFIATKVITTAQEFQDINENLNGFYILGNDIDLSTIANFEPLGKFYEETSLQNAYFHGVLEGNGYTVKNAKVYYNESNKDSEGVYLDGGLFKEACHQSGNNIGLFQIIGSSGVVRNVRFDNIKVRGRTIVGVIAGNVSGRVENCIVTESCSVQMGTHFYDNDCNAGGVAGIVAASGVITNTVCLTSSLFVPNEFTDYSADYIGKIGNGWDHVVEEGNNDAWWKYANVDRPQMDYSSGSAVDTGSKEIDSNGVQTNGLYAFAGKTWGSIYDSYSLKFTNNVYESQARDICFTQTHLSKNKPASGDVDMGTVDNCAVLTKEELESVTTYSQYDSTIWNLKEGEYPTLNYPLIKISKIK